MIVSKQGGVNIEDVAATNPEAVAYLPIDVSKGLTPAQANSIADKLGLTGNSKEIASLVASNLYELFVEKDALLLEINPFAEDICGECTLQHSEIRYEKQKRSLSIIKLNNALLIIQHTNVELQHDVFVMFFQL